MKKSLFLFIATLLCFNSLFAQHTEQEFWNQLLNNNRESAEALFKNIETGNIKKLVIAEILRNESGKFIENKSFIEDFVKQNDFEYYLYALWNKPYVFDTYLTTGFNKKNKGIIQKILKSDINNSTINDAVMYLNSVIARENGDWNTYFELNKSINVIRDWSYCGVFENLNKSGLDRFYAPEKEAFSEADFDAKSNGYVNWYTSNNNRDAYKFFENHTEYGSGVHYAQTFIEAKEDDRVTLRVGSGSAFKIWLNDVLVYENPEDVVTELNAYKVRVTIPKGNNRLLIKLAESTGVSYFIASILDENDKHNTTLTNSSVVKRYNKSSLSDINPEILGNNFETYFKNKIQENPNDFFYAYCLSGTYLRSSKYKEAKDLILPFLEKYPKSSFIRKMLMTIYSVEGDATSYNELRKNLELDDPNYYLPLVLKVRDFDELGRMSVSELDGFLEKFKKAVDHKVLHLTADFIYNARREDISAIKKNLDDLTKLSKDNLRLQLAYIPLYESLFKEDNKTIKLLEDLNSKHFNYSAVKMLSNYYENRGETNKVLKLRTKDLDNLINDNSYLMDLINKLHSYQKYDESLKYIDIALKNFPYSFQVLESKGDALVQLNRKEEAIDSYEKSLKANSANNTLRKKIKDLKNEPNILSELTLKDGYKYIADNRGKIIINNYGYNILLDDSNIELYREGGGEYIFTYIYEITSNSGVESFKEYNLGLSGNYHISKSEIVKANSSIVPADKSRSNLVFNGLSVGDVIYIEYRNSFSSSGRFYKDYSDKFMFNSYHPTVKSSLKMVTPKGHKLFYKMVNGDLEPEISQIGNFDLYNWTVENLKGLEQPEDYMPSNVDVVEYLHISTIPTWNDVSVWYSDLVRSSIEETTTVKEAFNKIFPDGYSQLSEEQRAENIYNYIKNNFNYSYVSFRQSGFVPQKPTKTIKTNLGDCKDFSTLFVTLANMAELNSNLVLILTADNGKKDLVFPSTNFNHCIAKVEIDGEPQFLELTDKYLPFKALPRSLANATGLEIPFKSNTNQEFSLFTLKNLQRESSVYNNKAVVNIGDNEMKMSIDTKFTGHVNSYYAEILAEPNAEVVKKSIYEDLSSLIEEDFVLDELLNIERIDNDNEIKYTSKITIDKKINKIGSIRVFQLPTVSSPYTKHVANLEKRHYPIEYTQYENVDEYFNSYDLFIDEDKTFTEIPKNAKFEFKDHSYQISYTLVKNNHLKVSMHSKPSLQDILPDDYEAFKTYVKLILEAESEFIGFQ